jgi:nitrous oxidase accessory protein NosD
VELRVLWPLRVLGIPVAVLLWLATVALPVGSDEYIRAQGITLNESVGAVGRKNATLLITDVKILSGDLNIPKDVALLFKENGAIDRRGYRLTINGVISAPHTRIFLGGGLTVFGIGFSQGILPQWWGFSKTETPAKNAAALEATLWSASGRGTVMIPEGTYRVAPDARKKIGENIFAGKGDMPVGVDVPSGTTLVLAQNAILQATPAGPFHSLFWIYEKSNVRISGGQLAGGSNEHIAASGGEWGFGIVIAGSSGVSVEGTQIRDFQGDAIYIGSSLAGRPASRIGIVNGSFMRSYRNGVTVAAGMDLTIKDIRIEESGYGYRSPRPAIDVETELGSVANLGINNVRAINQGIWIQAVAGRLVEGLTIADTSISDSNDDGIKILAASGGATKDVLIQSNVVQGAKGYGIQLSAVSPRSVKLMDNRVESSGEDGILVYATDYAKIEGNTVVGSSQAADRTYSNIKIAVRGNGNEISGNRIRRGSQANGPKFGIEIDVPSSIGNKISRNDMTLGGKVRNLWVRSPSQAVVDDTNVGAD